MYCSSLNVDSITFPSSTSVLYRISVVTSNWKEDNPPPPPPAPEVPPGPAKPPSPAEPWTKSTSALPNCPPGKSSINSIAQEPPLPIAVGSDVFEGPSFPLLPAFIMTLVLDPLFLIAVITSSFNVNSPYLPNPPDPPIQLPLSSPPDPPDPPAILNLTSTASVGIPTLLDILLTPPPVNGTLSTNTSSLMIFSIISSVSIEVFTALLVNTPSSIIFGTNS